MIRRQRFRSSSKSLKPKLPDPLGSEDRSEDARRQDALDRAFSFISRRERTQAQLVSRLERDGVEEGLVADVVGQMVADGYISDQRYAALYAEDRRNLDGWGNERIASHLREVGISPEIVAAVVDSRSHSDQVDDGVAVLSERVGKPPSDERERERALGVLARRGYSLEVAYEAVRKFERAEQ
ncbi:MAG: hypothetical protein F2813_07600 [Actinobacteria bacterium]|uniref:Regulatory protein RecX n=1 Tax=freshwater metagenome TaxID=449393 RepID=A0A6J5ZWW1_9ZZZZ|nr:hypothetical protein [Actinomycetota bacterium]